MKRFEDFLKLYEASRRMVVLTGAGISTLSGIPDFRSSDGLYSKDYGHMRVEEIVSIGFFRNHPDVFYSWAKEYWYHIEDFKPNIIHTTLARMEKAGKLTDGIFTQNIDFLHERAGSRQVYNLHGTLQRGFCMDCHSFMSYGDMAERVRRDEVPRCGQCGGVIKPDIVFYDDMLDSSMLDRASSSFSYCDLVLVLGSSLIVNPAASLPYHAVRSGHDVVIVNRDRTYLDEYCSLHYDDLEEFFTAMARYLDEKKNI